VFAQSDVYLLQLDASQSAVTSIRQVTTDTQVDWPMQWAPDGSSFLLVSNRQGTMGTFRQPVAGETPVPLIAISTADARSPQLTSDGKWIVYVEMTGAPDSARVMRVPAAGGPAQPVLAATAAVGTSRLQYTAVSPGAAGTGGRSYPEVRCPPRAAGGACFVADLRPGDEGGAVLLRTFDPATGSTREIGTLVSQRAVAAFWDISPDGTMAASGTFDWAAGNEITLLNLADGSRRTIRLAGVTNLNDIAWNHDGRSLLATAVNIRRAEVYRVSLDGSATLLRGFDSQIVSNPRPSPDGRSLLVGIVQQNANAWLIER
jgi:Tol biopolymer transport system component